MNRIVGVKSLLLAGALTAGFVAFASQGHAQSLGEIAKQQKPKDAKITTKRVFTDDDVSHTTQPVDSSPKSLQEQLADVESLASRLADKSPRQLGEDIVHENQFPDRSQWEQKLYDQKEKLVAASRALMATVKAGANDGIVSVARTRLDSENRAYNNLRADGLAKAADWERQIRR